MLIVAPIAETLIQIYLRAKLRVGPAAARWCKEQWGHRLDSLFLQTKNQLDRASCRLIRLRNKSLATELYHRIKAKEVSFAEAAREFGEGPEKHKDGLITLRPLGSMPFGLAPVLDSPKPGTIKPTVTPRQRFLSRGVDRVSKQSIRRGHWRSPAWPNR